MHMRKVKAGFVGFGKVFSPRELIEKKCREAQLALEARDMELIAASPVSSDAGGCANIDTLAPDQAAEVVTEQG